MSIALCGRYRKALPVHATMLIVRQPFSFSFARWIVPCFLGGLTVLGFAPFYLFFVPLVTLAWLFHRWRDASPRGAALSGFAFGLGFFGVGVSWVYVSMHDYGSMPVSLSAVATLLFCAFLALFPAAVGFLQAWLCRAPAVRPWLAALLWTLAAWIRGWLFTGFPWLVAGYSQVPSSPLAGLAPVVGIYGVTLAVTATAAALTQLIAGGARRRIGVALAVLWLGSFALQRIDWTYPVGKPLTVSLLQGDIPQELKWRDDAVRWSLATYAKLALNSTSRLIVMPETALPLFYRDVPREYLDGLTAYAKSIGSDMLIGLPEAETAGNTHYFNSVLSFGASPTQVYRKYHLVPFGEYIPFKPLFGWVVKVLKIPLADFSRGAKFQRPLRVSGQAVAVDICYEDVFGEEVIRQLPQATLLVNVSDDAWFGDSIAPWQHLQFSQTRALETGRYMLRATNTGVTAIIDQRGRVLKHMPEFKAAALNGVAQGFAGETPYVRFGNSPALAVLFAGLALVLLRARRLASR